MPKNILLIKFKKMELAIYPQEVLILPMIYVYIGLSAVLTGSLISLIFSIYCALRIINHREYIINFHDNSSFFSNRVFEESQQEQENDEESQQEQDEESQQEYDEESQQEYGEEDDEEDDQSHEIEKEVLKDSEELYQRQNKPEINIKELRDHFKKLFIKLEESEKRVNRFLEQNSIIKENSDFFAEMSRSFSDEDLSTTLESLDFEEFENESENDTIEDVNGDAKIEKYSNNLNFEFDSSAENNEHWGEEMWEKQMQLNGQQNWEDISDSDKIQ